MLKFGFCSRVTSRTGALNKKLADELFDPGPKGEAVHPGSEGSRYFSEINQHFSVFSNVRLGQT